MGRKDKESNDRNGRTTWFGADTGNDETRAEDRSANYGDVVKSMSTNTDDSSHAHESEVTSDNSRYTTEEDSTSAGSSFETESYLSSILEEMDLAADTEELLESDQMLTYESRPGLVGGWFDFACGWMDRPNLCVVPQLTGGGQTSLLRQSKAANAMHRVKLNETFKKAADNASASNEKKSKFAVERIQRDVAKAAAAAAESVRKHEVQPPELTAIQEERDEEEEIPKRKTSRKASKIIDDQRDEDIEAKMKKVSARAAEILKNTIEARAKTPKEREDSPPKARSHADIRKKVFDQLARDHRTTSSAEENTIENKEGHNSGDAEEVAEFNMIPNEPKEQSTNTVMSTHSVVASDIQDNTVATEDIHNVEEISKVTQIKDFPEDDDIESVKTMTRSSSVSPSPKEQGSSDSNQPDISENLSITDLTHIDDSNHDDEDEEVRKLEEQLERRETSKPPKLRRKSPHKRSTRLASLHKNDLGKRDVEFIDVLELDDEDSWTPGERIDARPSRSIHNSNHPSGNRSPVKSDRASLFGASIPVSESHQEQRQPPKKLRDAEFNDPKAREAFAGLRRGHLETNNESTAPRSQTTSIIETEMATRRGKSQESRHFAEKPMKPRRHVAAEITNSANGDDKWNADSSSRRSAHLVAVRSIDEAQRLRKERSRDLPDSGIHAPSRSRDLPRESVNYIHRTPARPESPLDVHPYMVPKAMDHEVAAAAAARSGRTYHHQYDSSRQGRHPSAARQNISLDQELYGSVVINLSKSRDGNSSEYVEERGADRNSRNGYSRGRDTRDDSDTPYNSGRSDPIGYNPHHQYGDNMSSRRVDGAGVRLETEQMRDFRKMEKKIHHQLNVQDVNGWDDRPAVSVKHLRQLESKLVQSLKEENEKRTDKLQRIRGKKPSRKGMEGEVSSVITESMMPPHRSVSPEKGVDMQQDGRFKYNHLKVLRQARQMHKFMHQRTSSRTSSHGAAPRPEAY